MENLCSIIGIPVVDWLQGLRSRGVYRGTGKYLGPFQLFVSGGVSLPSWFWVDFLWRIMIYIVSIHIYMIWSWFLSPHTPPCLLGLILEKLSQSTGRRMQALSLFFIMWNLAYNCSPWFLKLHSWRMSMKCEK